MFWSLQNMFLYMLPLDSPDSSFSPLYRCLSWETESEWKLPEAILSVRGGDLKTTQVSPSLPGNILQALINVTALTLDLVFICKLLCSPYTSIYQGTNLKLNINCIVLKQPREYVYGEVRNLDYGVMKK